MSQKIMARRLSVYNKEKFLERDSAVLVKALKPPMVPLVTKATMKAICPRVVPRSTLAPGQAIKPQVALRKAFKMYEKAISSRVVPSKALTACEKTVTFTKTETSPRRTAAAKVIIPRVLNQFPPTQHSRRSVLGNHGITPPHT